MADPGAAHDVDGASDVGEWDFIGAFDEGNFVGALLKNILELRAERGPAYAWTAGFGATGPPTQRRCGNHANATQNRLRFGKHAGRRIHIRI